MITAQGFRDFTLLDTTLRDGGHVIDGKFPLVQNTDIQVALDAGGVDIIEIGQLVPKTKEKTGTFVHKVGEFVIKSSLTHSRLAFLVRPDWTPAREISRAREDLGIVRVAFHQKDLEVLGDYIEVLREKEYDVYLNPINTPQYESEDLEKIASIAKYFGVKNVSIVDTYGSLSVKKFHNLIQTLDERLDLEVTLGLHSHDNKGMSMLFALSLLQSDSPQSIGRPVSIDATLAGMGRAPGNLKTESIILETAKDKISNEGLGSLLSESAKIQELYNSSINWGYDIHYLITAMWGIDRTYGEYLINENHLSYFQKLSIVSQIADMPGRKTFSEALFSELVESALNV